MSESRPQETGSQRPRPERNTRLRLRVVEIQRESLHFEACVGGVCRPVSALLRPDGAPEFPHLLSDAGESLGDDELDQRVRERATEIVVLRGRRMRRRRR